MRVTLRSRPRLCFSALVAAFAGLLAGCAGPQPADWALASKSALEAHQAAYFSGNARVAESELARALREAGATGDTAHAARIELFGCALRTAALEFDDCPGYTRFAADAAAPERAYAAYLKGEWQGLDTSLLPAAQRAVPGRGSDALAGIGDPLSRLVAAGALLRAGRIAPAGIAAAIDTASARGWRRPLVAWLGVELKRAEAAGDSDAAGRLRRRIALASGG